MTQRCDIKIKPRNLTVEKPYISRLICFLINLAIISEGTVKLYSDANTKELAFCMFIAVIDE